MASSERIFAKLQKIAARNVATLRAKNGLTFEALGQRSGLHWRHIQKIEAGEGNITMMTLARLAHGFNVEAARLLYQDVDSI